MFGDPIKKQKKDGAATKSHPARRKRPERPRSYIPARQTQPINVKRGASAQKVTLQEYFSSYLENHWNVLKESAKRLRQTPIATAMTVAVIAIALALPAGLYVLLKNVQVLSDSWDGQSQISLFLKEDVTEEQGKKLSEQLIKDEQIGRTEYISRQQALDEFMALSGIGDVLSVLDENPLPAVVIVFPESNSVDEAEQLRAKLQENQLVDTAQLDAEWVRRLQTIVALAERLVLALGIGLALAVLLVMVNTIRLGIESRKEEIIVMKLVGGTDGFVRRPFLYTGFLYGLGGGVLAILLVQSVLFWLESPVEVLSSLYDSQFSSLGLGFLGIVFIVFFSAMIGLLGAWVAVARHIREIEPE